MVQILSESMFRGFAAEQNLSRILLTKIFLSHASRRSGSCWLLGSLPVTQDHRSRANCIVLSKRHLSSGAAGALATEIKSRRMFEGASWGSSRAQFGASRRTSCRPDSQNSRFVQRIGGLRIPHAKAQVSLEHRPKRKQPTSLTAH